MAGDASNGSTTTTTTAATTTTTASEGSKGSKGSTLPAWLIRTIWAGHRALYRLTGGRAIRRATERQWGMLRLTTVGRRTGRERVAIVGFIEDGANVVTPAMNGWMDPEPAWWLNLQSNPDARVTLPGGTTRDVTAHAATGEERERLWQRFVDLKSSAFTDEYAALRTRETAIVVFEPRGPERAN